ncbi:hypothetical protein [Endozoicomonas sp. YOMI1]|uniref:hypothetical protein n=1 Tax=Endozoicomonas sp. YOMI1 TaxID=2828739 RepID=UPI0021490B7F|nr:hypothetical protein [Endozoicomonas sp. YOMI1]
MHGNQPVGAAGQTVRPPYEKAATDQAPPCASASQDKQTEQALFCFLKTTVQEPTVNLIQTKSEEHQCQPKKLAKALVEHLIEYFDLKDLQPSSTVSGNRISNSTTQNPINPDDWDWDLWEFMLYNAFYNSNDNLLYMVDQEEILGQVEIKLNVHFKSNPYAFSELKHLPSVINSGIGAAALQEMKHFLEIKDGLRCKSRSLAPVIKDCISNAMLPGALIDELYKMAIPDSPVSRAGKYA